MDIQEHINAALDHVVLAATAIDEKEHKTGTPYIAGLLEGLIHSLDYVKRDALSNYDW